MNSNISIELTTTDAGLATLIKNVRITGATLSYGINKLPIAHVHIDTTVSDDLTSSLQILCDFDKFRRKTLSLTVKTGGLVYDAGCLEFDGILDGISISQQPGGLSASLVIKHQFVLLNEVYPRLLGLSAGSSNMFSVMRPILYDPNQFGPGSENNHFLIPDMQLYGLITGKDPNNKVNTGLPLIPFIIEVFKAVVKNQSLYNIGPNTPAFQSISNALRDVIKEQQINADKTGELFKLVMKLLGQVNTEYSSLLSLSGNDHLLSAASPTIAAKVIGDIAQLDDTIYNSMVRYVGQYGCCFVVSNDTAYVVPDASFLRVEVDPSLIKNSRSLQTNIAYPADYETFSFNDTGENTIKGVYVVPEPLGMNGTWAVGGINVMSGRYVDPNPGVKGNIVVKTLPQIACSYISRIASQGSMGVQKIVHTGNSLIDGAIDTVEAYASMQLHKIQTALEYGQMQAFINAWAQSEYCRIKYEDRTGYLSMPFNNNWVPGAPGAALAKHPGTWVQFYVTDVTHTFNLMPNNSGTATTNVSFKGGRPGLVAGYTGLTTVPLYNYSYALSQNFADQFLADITP
jgi:hypothetical protein